MADAKIVLSAADRTHQAFDSVRRNLGGLHDQAARLPAVFGALGVAVAGAFSVGSLRGSLDMLDRLDKLREKTGLSVESLSALRYAGQLSGVSIEELGGGMRKLAATMSDAARGGKEAHATFAAMGVQVTTAGGGLRSLEDVLGDVADRFAGYEDGAAKSVLAQRAFGRAGADLIPLLNQGSVGLRSMRDEAERMGAVFSGDLARAAVQFNDNLQRLASNAEGAKIALISDSGLLPALNKVVEGFMRMREAGLVWDVLKDAAKGVVGFGRLSDNPGADVSQLMAERERRQRDLDFAERRGLATRDLRAELQQLDGLLQVSRIRQQARALADPGDASDALSRRTTQRAGARREAPTLAKVGSESQDNQALAYLSGLRREWDNLTGAGTKLSEVLGQLDVKGAKFTREQREQALGLAGQIDAWRTRQRLLESDSLLLTAQADALERNEDAVRQATDALRHLAREQALEIEQLGQQPEVIERATFMRRLDADLARAQAAALQGVNEGAWEQAEAMRQIASATTLAGQARAAFIARQADQRDRTINPQRGVADAVRDYHEQLGRQGEAAREATARTLGGMEDALIGFVSTGKLSVRGLVDSILSEMLRLQIIKPMLAQIFGAGGVGGGLFGSLFGGGAGAGFMNEMGGMELAGSLGFHSGGVVGRDAPTFRRMVPASLFDHATRYHGGGLVGGEVPAILQRGEGVFTQEQMRALGGARTSITMPVSVQVDSRSDRAQVISDVGQVVRENNRQLIDQLRELGVVPA